MNKKIYKYNDGESDVFADPTELDYWIDKLGIEKLLLSDRIAGAFPEGVDDPDKVDPMDMRLILDSSYEADPLIRQAFKVKPFDRTTGEGLLFEEVLNLFTDYTSWRAGLKKNTEDVPSSAGNTG